MDRASHTLSRSRSAPASSKTGSATLRRTIERAPPAIMVAMTPLQRLSPAEIRGIDAQIDGLIDWLAQNIRNERAPPQALTSMKRASPPNSNGSSETSDATDDSGSGLSESSQRHPRSTAATAIAKGAPPVTKSGSGSDGDLSQSTSESAAKTQLPTAESVSASDDESSDERSSEYATPAGSMHSSDSDDGSSDDEVPVSPRRRPATATCCGERVDMLHGLRAGLSSAVSSSGYLIFGKDVPEAIMASAFLGHGIDPTQAPYSYVIAGTCGSWYGICHQVVSKFTAGWMSSLLSLNRFSPTGTEWEKQEREFLPTTLPGLITYTLCHAVRGSLTEGISDPWEVGLAKFVASCVAGALAGILTDLICQANPNEYKKVAPTKTVSENLRIQMNSLIEDINARKVGHDYAGKILGSAGGMFAAVPIAPLDLPGAVTTVGQGATQGALAKFIFQAGFYAGVHTASSLGHGLDLARIRARLVAHFGTPANGAPPDVVTKLPDYIQDVEVSAHSERSDSGSSSSSSSSEENLDEITVDIDDDALANSNEASSSQAAWTVAPAPARGRELHSIRRCMIATLNAHGLVSHLGQDQLDRLAVCFIAHRRSTLSPQDAQWIDALVSSLPAGLQTLFQTNPRQLTQVADALFSRLDSGLLIPEIEDVAEQFVSEILTNAILNDE